jgi:hypothetical protein
MKIEVPLYVVAWRLIWFVPVIILRVLLTVAAFCGWGLDSAQRVWEDTK